MLISLVNQKGGVGKTTVAINLAAGLVRHNRSTLLIDADPQGSVVQWQSVENNHLLCEEIMVELPNRKTPQADPRLIFYRRNKRAGQRQETAKMDE